VSSALSLAPDPRAPLTAGLAQLSDLAPGELTSVLGGFAAADYAAESLMRERILVAASRVLGRASVADASRLLRHVVALMSQPTAWKRRSGGCRGLHGPGVLRALTVTGEG
jgi:hypothetical protein